MIKDAKALRELDERFEREHLADMSYHEALARFTALWNRALELGSVDHSNWLEDLEPDLRIARALNALSEAD